MIAVATITLTGSAQNVADSFAVPAGISVTGRAASDLACRTISLQADGGNTHLVCIGADNTVTTSVYGLAVPIPVGGAVAAPVILGEYDQGGIRLSDLWIIGTAAEKLHVLAVSI